MIPVRTSTYLYVPSCTDEKLAWAMCMRSTLGSGCLRAKTTFFTRFSDFWFSHFFTLLLGTAWRRSGDVRAHAPAASCHGIPDSAAIVPLHGTVALSAAAFRRIANLGNQILFSWPLLADVTTRCRIRPGLSTGKQ
jgi:hypothetical protein